MRIGSFFTILAAAMVALGFLLSDWFHIQHEIGILQEENRGLRAQLQQANEIQTQTIDALNSAKAHWQACEEDANRLKVDKQALLNQVSVLEGQNQSLEADNSILMATLQGLIGLQALTYLGATGLFPLLSVPGGISVAAFLSISLARKKKGQATKHKSYLGANSYSVRLTKEEREIIIAHRRKHD
jgi:hypothetical protein